MRLRIGYAAEMVLMMAAGMALLRWVVLGPGYPRILANLPSLHLANRLHYFTEPFLAGVALAGGLGLMLEAARRRSPPTWGIGRRTWSIAALTVIFESAAWSCMQLAVLWRRRGMMPDPWSAIEFMRSTIQTTFYPHAGLAIAAMGLTSLFDGRPGDSSPDAREWAGRTLLILIVAQSLAIRILGVFT